MTSNRFISYSALFPAVRFGAYIKKPRDYVIFREFFSEGIRHSEKENEIIKGTSGAVLFSNSNVTVFRVNVGKIIRAISSEPIYFQTFVQR